MISSPILHPRLNTFRPCPSMSNAGTEMRHKTTGDAMVAPIKVVVLGAGQMGSGIMRLLSSRLPKK